MKLSQGEIDGIDSDDSSPRGSIDGSAEKKKKKRNMVEPTVEKIDADDSINHRDTADSRKKPTDDKVLTYSEHGDEPSGEHLRLFQMDKDERTNTMVGFTGEKDYEIAPKSENLLHWHEFCTDMYSSNRSI